MTNFHNRFLSLEKWADRITDADYYSDYNPRFFKEDKSMMKYDIFLSEFWTWENPTHHCDCHRTETFRTLSDVKQGLRNAVKLGPDSPICKQCPHLKSGHCHA